MLKEFYEASLRRTLVHSDHGWAKKMNR